MKRVFAIAVVAGVVILAAALALATRGADPGAVPTVREVSERTMSPFCPGLTLSECPSQQSAELRSRIGTKIDAGWTNRRIDEWLVASYGEGVLAKPTGPVAYLVPIAVLLGGAGLVGFLTLRWARSRRDEDEPPLVSDAERERLARDLKVFAEGTE